MWDNVLVLACQETLLAFQLALMANLYFLVSRWINRHPRFCTTLGAFVVSVSSTAMGALVFSLSISEHWVETMEPLLSLEHDQRLALQIKIPCQLLLIRPEIITDLRDISTINLQPELSMYRNPCDLY